MKKLALAFLLVASYSIATAQGVHYTDSLQTILQKTPKDTNYVATLLNLADAIVYDSPDSAMGYTMDALELSKKIKSPKNIALSYNEIGIVYYVKGKNLEALDFFQKAMKEGEPLHNNKLNGRIFNNIANLYSDLKQYDKALDYYDKLIVASRKANLRNDEAIALFNIGTVYNEQNNYSKALSNFNQSLSIASADSNMKMLPFILSNIGIVYNKEKEYAQAFPNFEKAIRYADMTKSEPSKAQALEGLARIYLANRDYDRAEKFARQSLVIAKQINSPQWLADAWETMSDTYEAQHNPGKALYAYKNYVRFKDSLFNDNKRTELTRKEIQFDFEKKDALIKNENDKQLALVNAKAEKERIVKNSLASVAVMTLLTAFVSFFFYKRKRDADQKKKEAEFRVEATDTEMKVLRLQMNPHFIFNSLNSISDYISKHDIQTADCYLTKFAKVMRLTLEYSDQKAISLAEDLNALELYMQLEALRLDNKFTYEIKVDEGINADNVLVPPMLLQPFVENSIWHGIADKTGDGKICIEVKRESEMINCTVEDNGVGRKHSNPSLNVRKSLGMKITKARIDLLNTLKKSRAAIELSDLQQGLKVQVKLPLELNI